MVSLRLGTFSIILSAVLFNFGYLFVDLPFCFEMRCICVQYLLIIMPRQASLDCDEAKQDIEPNQPECHLENSVHNRLEQLQHLQPMAQLTYRALLRSTPTII